MSDTEAKLALIYLAEIRRLKDQNQRYEKTLAEVAGPSPRSQRKEVEQLRDAVKWRQGIARDALAREALAGDAE